MSTVSAIITEIWRVSGASTFNVLCTHANITPRFDAEACRIKPVSAIQREFPRVSALCTTCGQQVRAWASIDHMKALGDA